MKKFRRIIVKLTAMVFALVVATGSICWQDANAKKSSSYSGDGEPWTYEDGTVEEALKKLKKGDMHSSNTYKTFEEAFNADSWSNLVQLQYEDRGRDKKSKAYNPDGLTITMVNVGKGSSVLVQTPHSNTLVGMGPATSKSKMTNKTLSKVLKSKIKDASNNPIDFVLLTGFGDGQIGGLNTVKEYCSLFNLKSKTEVYPDGVLTCLVHPITGRKGSSAYTNFMTAAASFIEGIPIQTIEDKYLLPVVASGPYKEAGRNKSDSYDTQEVKYLFLADESDTSAYIARIEYDGISMLFADGVTAELADAIRGEWPTKTKCDIILLPNGGSKGCISEAFLRNTGAKYALISGTPDSTTIKTCESLGMTVLRTDKDGTVTLTVNNGKYKVSKEK